PVQSHAVRREYFTRLIARGGMRIDVCPDDIAIEGATAIVRGRVEIRAASEGESGMPVRELRYLEVARKGLDGLWTAVCGMDGPVQDA
ncbi:MAG TPA: hypothetical protein VLT86_20400, partial [Vicinamibacterales bacterium]|nr:hypothetical protein [Vicinamibacterales bacterium]